MDGRLQFEKFRENITRIILWNPYYNSVFSDIDISTLLNPKYLASNDFYKLFVKGDTFKIPIQTGYYAFVDIQALPVGILTDIPVRNENKPMLNDNILVLDEALTRNGLVIAEIYSEMSSEETTYAFTSINTYTVNYRPSETLRYITIKPKLVVPAFAYKTFDQTQWITLAISKGGYKFLTSENFMDFAMKTEYYLVIYVPMFIITIKYLEAPHG